MSRSNEQFEETALQVTIRGKKRPVLKLGQRLYAGDTLCVLNPSGAEGRVWSALTRDELQHNIDQAKGRHGTGH